MNTNYSIIFSPEISVDNNKLKYYERVASENAFHFHNYFLSNHQQHEFASPDIDKHVILIRTKLINIYNITLFMPFNLLISENKINNIVHKIYESIFRKNECPICFENVSLHTVSDNSIICICPECSNTFCAKCQCNIEKCSMCRTEFNDDTIPMNNKLYKYWVNKKKQLLHY